MRLQEREILWRDAEKERARHPERIAGNVSRHDADQVFLTYMLKIERISEKNAFKLQEINELLFTFALSDAIITSGI